VTASKVTMPSKRITVVHCWSAPRSRSTALCYSFEARGSDCVAIDEPLYVDWLKSAAGDSVSRPYQHDLIHGIPPKDATPEVSTKWRRELLSLEDRTREAAELLPDGGVIFCKEMAKFFTVYDFNKEASGEDLDIELIHKHLLLIRDPVAVLSSWSAADFVHGGNPSLNEVGIVPMLSIYATLQGKGVALLDSDELVADPFSTLKALCEELGFPFKESM